ncbi:peptidoglycan-binding LysM, partial [Metarhizium brunneum ARSEF 3297]
MGRWSHLDPDYERLPEGISRVGYDADTESYTFQDRSGSYWESRPGRRYGPLRRVHTSPSVQTVPVGDAPHAARIDKMLKDAHEFDVEEGVEDEESELYQRTRTPRGAVRSTRRRGTRNIFATSRVVFPDSLGTFEERRFSVGALKVYGGKRFPLPRETPAWQVIRTCWVGL